MKKLFCLLLILSMLSLIACTQQKEQHRFEYSEVIVDDETIYTKGVYEIEILELLITNNSVGDEWQLNYICNGETISSGKRWIVPLDIIENTTIDINITEKDKFPDVGTDSLSVTLAEGFQTSTTIVITENRGKYCGNIAEWEITFVIKLVERI